MFYSKLLQQNREPGSYFSLVSGPNFNLIVIDVGLKNKQPLPSARMEMVS